VIVPEPDCEIVPVRESGVDIAVYAVTVSPLLFAGAVNVIVAEFGEVAVAVPIVGASGAPTKT
jgi:hypothetical protein